MGRNDILSRRAVEAMIAEGSSIVISEGRALRLDSWLDRHPGGKLAIAHMVGRDATDEINISHSVQTCRMMGAYRIGLVDLPWTNFTPPIRGGHYRKLGDETDPKDEQELAETSCDEDDTSGSSDGKGSAWSSAASDSSSLLDGVSDNDCVALPSSKTTKATGKHLEVLGARSRHEPSLHVAASAEIETPNLARTRDAYINDTMQKEIDDSLRDYPSLDEATQLNITNKYRVLHARVQDEGFYDCRYIEYGKECVRYSILFVAFLVALRYEWYMTSAGFLGVFWQQIMFTAHDAGHRGITHNFVIDTLIGMFIADLCCGLSIGWWKSSHNVHHLVTNHPEHDPDIQNVPLFSTSPSFFRSIKSTYYKDSVFPWDAAADFSVRFQKYTYYPVMAVARFNLYMLSCIHILSIRSTTMGAAAWTRPAEIVFMAGYWYLFGYCLVWKSLPTWNIRIAFVLFSHLVTFPLHVQITLSHWAMPTADLGEAESFPQRQLRTTMDVDCPTWLDFFHGGLQFQAVHHLFPRVPRHNLRRLQVLVREFCKETEIEYKILGFVDGNKSILTRLEEVQKQASLMIECQNYMARTGESGLH